MNKRSPWPTLNILAAAATIIVNGLANALPINNQTTAAISDRFQVYFTPAGYVFSIWGLIYLALIAFVVYQALPAQRANPRLARIGPWFVVASLANMGWILLWHYEYFLWTLVAMITLLVSLILVYTRLGIGRVTVSPAERWLTHVPFSLYLGWITVATIANATALLWLARWNGWGVSPEAWTAVMIAAGAAIACLVTITRRDVVFPLVFVWAVAGIGIKHGAVPIVATAAWAACLVVLAAIVVGALRRHGSQGGALAAA